MHFHHNLQSAISPAYTLYKKLSKKNDSLRVLTYHDIPEAQIGFFREQLQWIKANWKIVTPNEFELMKNDEKPIIGPNVLITFDDGFKSNRIIADKVLKPMNIQAIFFIVSDFANLKNQEEAQLFIAKNIMPNSNINQIPENLFNMGWHDLEVLLDYGHTIGSHTKTHFRIEPSSLELDLKEQIFESGNTISKRLGVNVDHFAYTFGDLSSFSESALRVAKKRYKYIYSGIRGDNFQMLSSSLIKRDAAAYQLENNQYQLFSNKLLSSFMQGLADFRYQKQRNIIDSWTLK